MPKTYLKDLKPTKKLPLGDGDINLYISDKVHTLPFYNAAKHIIFVNGMANSPQSHKESCETLSYFIGCRVLGVYNATGFNGAGNSLLNGALDGVQCLLDRSTTFEQFKLLSKNARSEETERVLKTNPAAFALYQLIRAFPKLDIHAHSQGNYLTINALNALRVTDGPAALQGRMVYSYGSPSAGYPKEVYNIQITSAFDPVSAIFQHTTLDGILSWFKGRSVAVPGCFHGFSSYIEALKKDPSVLQDGFVNYQGDVLRLTSGDLDTKKLGAWAASQGKNFARVVAVFKRVEREHKNNIANICHHYMLAYGRTLRNDLATSQQPHAAKQLFGLIRSNASSTRLGEFGFVLRGEISNFPAIR